MALIEELVGDGVTTDGEMKRHLDQHVKKVLFPGGNLPKRTNKRFFPSRKKIRSNMSRFERKQRHAMIDQEALQIKVEKWKREDPTVNIFFRPKTGAVHEEKEEDDDSDDDEEENNENEDEDSGVELDLDSLFGDRYFT